MAKAYKLLNYNGVLSGIKRISDSASIPLSQENRDYVEYLAWLDDGNTADLADPDPAP